MKAEISDRQREEDLKWWKLIWNKLYDAQRGDVLSKRVGEYLSKPKKHHFVHSLFYAGLMNPHESAREFFNPSHFDFEPAMLQEVERAITRITDKKQQQQEPQQKQKTSNNTKSLIVLKTTPGLDPNDIRVDLGDQLFLAIDSSSTIVVDDAVSIKTQTITKPDGTLETIDTIFVLVADMTDLLSPGDALDGFARKRVSSVYFAEKVHHLYPTEFSSIPSLSNQKNHNDCWVFEMRLDSEGQEISDCKAYPAVCRNIQQLTPETADRLLADNLTDAEKKSSTSAQIKAMLDRMMKVAEGRLSYRTRNAKAKFFNLNPSVSVVFPEDDRNREPKIEISVSPQTKASSLVQEFMIMGGEGASVFSQKNNIPFLYRCQDSFEYATGESDIMNFIDSLPGFTKSYFSTTPKPHFVVGINSYARVTSPIRRYADSVCHFQLRDFLTKRPYRYSAAELEMLAKRITARSSEIRWLQHENSSFWFMVLCQSQPPGTKYNCLLTQVGFVNKVVFADTSLFLSVKNIDPFQILAPGKFYSLSFVEISASLGYAVGGFEELPQEETLLLVDHFTANMFV